jgi:hypothetical protein
VAVEAHLRVALAQYLNHCDPATIVEEAALIRKVLIEDQFRWRL